MGILSRRQKELTPAAAYKAYENKRESIEEQIDLCDSAVSFFRAELGESLLDEQIEEALMTINKVRDTLNNEIHQALRLGIKDQIRRRQTKRDQFVSVQFRQENRLKELEEQGYTEVRRYWSRSQGWVYERTNDATACELLPNDALKEKQQLQISKLKGLQMRIENEGWNFIFYAMDSMFNEAGAAQYLLTRMYSHYTDEESSDPEGLLNIDRDLCPEF